MPQEYRLILKHVDQPGYTPDLDCYLRHGGYEVAQEGAGASAEDSARWQDAQRPGAASAGGHGLRPARSRRGRLLLRAQVVASWIARAASRSTSSATRTNPSRARSRTSRSSTRTRTSCIEGMIIACYANDVHLAYIYIRGEIRRGREDPEPRAEGSAGEEFPRQEYPGQRLRSGDPRPPRRGRLHLRRGNRPDRVAGRQAALSADQAAVFPGGARALPCARPSSTTSRRSAR